MKTIIIDDKNIQISDESYEAFKKQFVSNDKAILWEPRNNEDYWFGSFKGVEALRVSWTDDSVNFVQYEMGNVFRTKEEAQQALDTGWIAKRKAEVKILRFIAENDLEFEPNWSNSQDKYFIYYSYNGGEFKIDGWTTIRGGTNLHFKSREDTQKVIDAMTPELKILFGVIN